MFGRSNDLTPEQRARIDLSMWHRKIRQARFFGRRRTTNRNTIAAYLGLDAYCDPKYLESLKRQLGKGFSVRDADEFLTVDDTHAHYTEVTW